MILGTFQYAFFRAVAVFLGLILHADGNYNPADVSAKHRDGQVDDLERKSPPELCQPSNVFCVCPSDFSRERGPLDQHLGWCLHPLWALGPGHPLPAGPAAPG